MAKESKYFYITEVPIGYKSKRQPRLVKWNEDYQIEVDENVDYHQYLSLYINKLSEKDTLKPESSSYEKVKPILKEIFIDHYSLALKFISEVDILDSELYLLKRSKDWFQIAYFSIDEKNKQNILIDFRDGIEDLWLMLHSSSNYRDRPAMRKDGAAISQVLFKQFLNLTLKFLYDPDSYKILLTPFLKDFHGLATGKRKVESLILSSATSFNNILEQLEMRKKNIEKRLIEVDKDSEFDRVRLRGEIDGINFAINTINVNK
jgi:hypothetical protein